MAKKVTGRSIGPEINMLHGALVDLITTMNRSQRRESLLEAAGATLDSALFPLLVGIARYGPVGVVELADRAGRDYTTVSRQVSKLQSLNLIVRRTAETDARVNEAIITDQGREMVAAIDAARSRILTTILADWADLDVQRLALLLRRLADSAQVLAR